MLIPLLAALAAPSPSPFIDPWPDIRLVGWWSRERTDTAHLASPLDARVLRPAGRGVSLSLEWRFDADGSLAPPPRPFDDEPFDDDPLDLDPLDLDPLDLDPLDLDPLDLDPLDLDDPWYAPDAFAGLPLTPPDSAPHPSDGDDGADADERDDRDAPVADPDARRGDPAPLDHDPPDRAARSASTPAGWSRRLARARLARSSATDPIAREHAQLDIDEARRRLALHEFEAVR